MPDEDPESIARKLLSEALKDHTQHLLTRAVRAGGKVANTLVIARNIDAATAAQLIADVWLDGYLASIEDRERHARTH